MAATLRSHVSILVDDRLVGQQNFVQVRVQGHDVVGEVLQPGAIVFKGINQQWHEDTQRNAARLLGAGAGQLVEFAVKP